MTERTAQFNRFTITMTYDQARECGGPGDRTRQVRDLWEVMDLSFIDDEELIAELSEYGAWDTEELQDRDENEMRIIWLAAGNILEEEMEENG